MASPNCSDETLRFTYEDPGGMTPGSLYQTQLDCSRLDLIGLSFPSGARKFREWKQRNTSIAVPRSQRSRRRDNSLAIGFKHSHPRAQFFEILLGRLHE